VIADYRLPNGELIGLIVDDGASAPEAITFQGRREVTAVHEGHTVTELRPGLHIESYADGGCILHGSPVVLARICAKLGFRNSCARGKVYLTATKTARLATVLP
jgi:hypothetical protein